MDEQKENAEGQKVKSEIQELIETSKTVKNPKKLDAVNKEFSFPKYLYTNNFKPEYHDKVSSEPTDENVHNKMNYHANPYFARIKHQSNDYPRPFYKKFANTNFNRSNPYQKSFYRRDEYSYKSHEYDKQILVPKKDEILRDTRTTVMIKNIPNRVTYKEMKEILDRYVFGKFNFFYLRFDFENQCNVGYAFINFAKPIYVIEFYKKFQGYVWDRKLFKTAKIVDLAYASFQGLEALKLKFSGSIVMTAKPEFRPKTFYTEGPEMGMEKPFAADQYSNVE